MKMYSKILDQEIDLCGDNSCQLRQQLIEPSDVPYGMYTNGGCRCKPHQWGRALKMVLIHKERCESE